MSAFQHFTPGSLPQLLRTTARSAIRSGALQPVSTECCYQEEAGIRFVIRIVANLERKAVARRLQQESEHRSGKTVNPFLPPDQRLLVTELSPTHRCILNKFNVVEHHLLIVTQVFQDQQEPLCREDFEALWLCLREIEGLGFYNAGRLAGASQRHKHLQLVSLPLAPRGPAIPLEPRLRESRSDCPRRVPGLPFRHCAVWPNVPVTAPIKEATVRLLRSYEHLADSLGIDVASVPYNLMITRDWMLLIPRSKERCGSISVNTLGFAGSLLVKSATELEFVREVGPLSVLAEVGVPPLD